jgi:23S rRNA (cytosine1962-C5)-methyltransferase
MSARPIVRLKPHEGRRARAGAPWVFSNEIVMDAGTKSLVPGSVVTLKGDDGQDFGTFYFNSKSLIAARLLDNTAGAPVDREFLTARIARALALREALFERPFYRLVNSEGDGLPGLTIDRFGNSAILQITTAGMENLLEAIVAALEQLLSPEVIVLKNDSPARSLEGLETYVRAIKGEAGRIVVEENDVRYFADPSSGQKTGWYYDQQENRSFIARLAKGASVLDAYSYAGGFTLAAAKAGAREAVGLDSSASALALAEESAAANRLSAKFVRCDVFEELERLAQAGETFNIVVADPPPFVRARKDLEPGAKAYRKLARLAARVTAPNGFLLLASCSHNISAERFGTECATGIARAERRSSLVRAAGAGPDHPVHSMLPEGAYLKALVYALD